MSSIRTNSGAMNALATLRQANKELRGTQERISTGLKVNGAKDNAAYFSISKKMQADSGALKSINEGLTLTRNSVATARAGAEAFQDLSEKFHERLAFAQGAKGGYVEIEAELTAILRQMANTIHQSTFNGDDLVNAKALKRENDGAFHHTLINDTDGSMWYWGERDNALAPERTVVTGISRADGFDVTTIQVKTVDLGTIMRDFVGIAANFATNAQKDTGAAYLKGVLAGSERVLASATKAATTLGVAETAIADQQAFLHDLTANIDQGVGAMIDADMEEEAARLQALQVQQQLATQSLSIANQAPQNLLSLFR